MDPKVFLVGTWSPSESQQPAVWLGLAWHVQVHLGQVVVAWGEG